MTILLTGATGFVGRNFLRNRTSEGAHVLAPVRDEAKLRRIMDEDGVDPGRVTVLPVDPALWPTPAKPEAAVLAAGALFERSLRAFCATNVDWTCAVLRALPPGCPAVVLSSQSAGGPTPPGREARDESCGDAPISAYGESKLRMERAIWREFGRKRTVILRPPMILGPKDAAVQQLFRMAAGPLRLKPGFRTKTFSYISCQDLLDAIRASFDNFPAIAGSAFYVAAPKNFSDRHLMNTAAATLGRKGLNLPVPQGMLRLAAALVDRLPALRTQLPSLTRERVKEVWPDRWVVDASLFRKATHWTPRLSLAAALDSAKP